MSLSGRFNKTKLQTHGNVTYLIFKSSKGNREEQKIFVRSDYVLVMVGDSTKNLIKVIFRSLLANYPKNQTEKMNGSNLAFDYVDVLYYSWSKVTVKRSGAYINFPEWLKY